MLTLPSSSSEEGDPSVIALSVVGDMSSPSGYKYFINSNEEYNEVTEVAAALRLHYAEYEGRPAEDRPYISLRCDEKVTVDALVEIIDLTREEESTSSNAVAVYGICFLLIYLLLASLYESYLTPFAVLLAVPAGLLGCLVFAKIMSLENNIYLQTGMIMIIGLLSKTAILLTEYATERRNAGMSLKDAALEAAGARLRPILMTVLMMIFGMLPLMFSSGVGANGNSSLGSGVVGGMLIGTIALLFLVPGLFIAFQWLQEKIHPLDVNPNPDEMIKREMEEVDKIINN